MQNMLPSELQELMADVAHVKLQDVHLGRVLEKLTAHLAHAHGLDTETVSEEEESPADEEEEAPAAPVAKGKGR